MSTPGTITLGFGCAGLAARLTASESRRLVDVAFDAGVRHFDVARSYGYGRAEACSARRSPLAATTSRS